MMIIIMITMMLMLMNPSSSSSVLVLGWPQKWGGSPIITSCSKYCNKQSPRYCPSTQLFAQCTDQDDDDDDDIACSVWAELPVAPAQSQSSTRRFSISARSLVIKHRKLNKPNQAENLAGPITFSRTMICEEISGGDVLSALLRNVN